MTAKKTTRTAKPAKPAAVEPTETIEAAVAAGKKEIVVKASADAATKGVNKAIAMSKEQFNTAAKAGTEVLKSYEDVVGFGKESIDAVVDAHTQEQGRLLRAFHFGQDRPKDEWSSTGPRSLSPFVPCAPTTVPISVKPKVVGSRWSIPRRSGWV